LTHFFVFRTGWCAFLPLWFKVIIPVGKASSCK